MGIPENQVFEGMKLTDEPVYYGCNDWIRNPPKPFLADVLFADPLRR
jgi:hypothetical protein